MAGIMSYFRQLLIILPVFLTFAFSSLAQAKDENCNSNRGGFAFPLPLDRIVDENSNPLAHKMAIIGGSDERLQVNPRKAELDRNDGLGTALDAVVHFYVKEGNTYSAIGTGVLTGARDTVAATAHQFYVHVDKKADARRPLSSIVAVIVGCPDRQFAISEADIPAYKTQASFVPNDVAFLRLSGSACDSVRPLLATNTTSQHVDYLSRTNSSVVVAGAYMPEVIQRQRIESFGQSAETSEAHMGKNGSKRVMTYYSVCSLDGSRATDSNLGAKSVYKHLCDTGEGGSGGPVLANFGPSSGGWRIIGIHRGSGARNNDSPVSSYNELIPINDKIFDRAAAFISAPRTNPRNI